MEINQMGKKGLPPGTPAPKSGQYERINSSGKGTGKEVTVTRGEPLPPTPKKRETYQIVDPTKH
jgi:hypothetical protein